MMGVRRQGSRLNGPCLPCPTLLCGRSCGISLALLPAGGHDCEPARHDCEPRINNVGLVADNVGRAHAPESMIVGREGCSIASRALN
jgi:hypothetical protein